MAAKAGDIEYDSDNNIQSLVVLGDNERDAVIRAEEFIRGYFGDNAFVGAESQTAKVGSTAKGDLYKVVSF